MRVINIREVQDLKGNDRLRNDFLRLITNNKLHVYNAENVVLEEQENA